MGNRDKRSNANSSGNRLGWISTKDVLHCRLWRKNLAQVRQWYTSSPCSQHCTPFHFQSLLCWISLPLSLWVEGKSLETIFQELSGKGREETNRKVVRMVVVVVSTFLLCWSLYFILMVLRKNGVHVPCGILYLRLLLVHFNAALTPWLYVMFSENYRQGFADVLFKWGCRVFAASVNHPVEDNTTTDSRQISATDQDFQLQTLPTSQCGSTTQLLNWFFVFKAREQKKSADEFTWKDWKLT